MTDFVNLHVHTSYSILDSLITPKELFAKVKELGQTAVAITDHGSLASAWTALKASKSAGVKLIIGCEMYFVNDVNNKEERFRHIILLAKNAVGYKNLLTLNKEGFDNMAVFAKRVFPLIDWNLLEKYSEGLICLTSCSSGILSQLLMSKKFDEAEIALDKLVKIFGRDNLGLEVQANTLKRNANYYHDAIEQTFVNHQIIKLAKKYDLRAVATTNAHYIKKEDADVHNVLLAIGSHQPIYSNFRLKYDCPDFYIKTGDEVKSFFERSYKDYASTLCENSVFFANLCEEPKWIDPKFSNASGKELPEFPVKDEPDYQEFLTWVDANIPHLKHLEQDKLFLRFRCEKYFETRVANRVDPKLLPEYHARIEEELEVFEFHGFSSYMLIVADFIEFGRSQNVPIAPGRGSIGGSLVGYLLGIHQADPVKYNLIFARFHNKEKSSFPDIDTDFASSGRDLVFDYINKKYGTEYVAHVSNMNTITPKVYSKDLARSCEFGGSKENATKIGASISDILPAEIHSIDSALENVPIFAEYAKRYPELKSCAAINGKPRAWSTHAAGIVISKRPLAGLVPIRRDKDGMIAIEYDKDQAEENGLVKIDLLGSTTLDIVETTLKLIKQAGKEPPSYPLDYDVYDKPTYDLISNGDTYGVFQLGTSAGTIDLCKSIKPKNLNDISYINALARPSARDMRKKFIQVKNGEKTFSLLHPKLGRAFNNTFGFGLYEESLFFLAQDIAGWSLHSADRLRKLTKEKGKNPKKAEEWRQEFIEDSVKNGVQRIIATRIWDEVISLFSGYGFNSSHSIFYSMIGYTTAYLKAHFPIEFLLANLMYEVHSNTKDAKANIAKIKKEIRARKVKILPPDLNKSQMSYTMTSDSELLTGFDALRSVKNIESIDDIISKRPFTSFLDFMSRIDSKKVKSNTIRALACSGCLDFFKIPRHLIYLYCQDYRKKLQTWMKRHDITKEEFIYPWPTEKNWTIPELYALEKFYLGEAFICGKKNAYDDFFKNNNVLLADLKKKENKTKFDSLKVEVKGHFEFKIKKAGPLMGKPMVKALVEDISNDQCVLTIFPDAWEDIQAKLKKIDKSAVFEEGVALHLSGSVNIYEDDFGIAINALRGIRLAPRKPENLEAKKIKFNRRKKGDIEDLLLDEQNENLVFDDLLEETEDFLYDIGAIEIEESEEDNDKEKE